MNATTITPEMLASSVFAVPPLALDKDGAPCPHENAKMVSYLREGGVTSYLYGGNANLFSATVSGYGALLDMFADICPQDGWMIPSFGPDYGKSLDQAEILKDHVFPTAMLLPMQAPLTADGIATGVRHISDKMQKQVIVYVKSEQYLTVPLIKSLLDDGVVCAVKYAIARKDPDNDPFLKDLVNEVGTERLVSGIGERPVEAHVGKMGLQSFTTGSVCLAPKLSMAYLAAMKASDFSKGPEIWSKFVAL